MNIGLYFILFIEFIINYFSLKRKDNIAYELNND